MTQSRRYPEVLACALALLLAACSSGGPKLARCDNTGGQPLASAAVAPWPKFHHDNLNTGRTAVDLSANTGSIRWTFPAAAASPTGGFSSSPAVTTERIYIGANDGALYALDPATGAQLDSTVFNFGGISAAIESSPAIREDGTIVVGTNANTLLIVNPDGTIEHSTTIGGNGVSSPALATDGTTYIGSLGAGSTGFFPAVCANGVARWTFVTDAVQAAPAIAPDGTVYFAAASSVRPYLRALDPTTGQAKWTFATSALIVASPVVAVDETTQKVDTIYVADSAGRLFAVKSDGTRKTVASGGFFLFTAGGEIVASPALASDGTIYVAAMDGALYAIDPATGQARWHYDTGSTIQSSPAVADDGGKPTIVFGADDGHVYRVVDEGGAARSLSWSVDVGGPVGRASPAIGADGTVYIGTEDGRVYAIGAAP